MEIVVSTNDYITCTNILSLKLQELLGRQHCLTMVPIGHTVPVICPTCRSRVY